MKSLAALLVITIDLRHTDADFDRVARFHDWNNSDLDDSIAQLILEVKNHGCVWRQNPQSCNHGLWIPFVSQREKGLSFAGRCWHVLWCCDPCCDKSGGHSFTVNLRPAARRHSDNWWRRPFIATTGGVMNYIQKGGRGNRPRISQRIRDIRSLRLTHPFRMQRIPRCTLNLILIRSIFRLCSFFVVESSQRGRRVAAFRMLSHCWWSVRRACIRTASLTEWIFSMRSMYSCFKNAKSWKLICTKSKSALLRMSILIQFKIMSNRW